MAIPVEDFLNGVDYTAYGSWSGALVNQGFANLAPNDNAAGAEAIGLTLWSKDSALDTPRVPDPSGLGAGKWKRYLWVRIPHTSSTSKNPIIYGWNDSAVSDATLLKWLTPTVDTGELQDQIDTLVVQVNALQTSVNNVLAQVTAAVTQSNAAVTTAQTAVNTATNALNAANTAETDAQTAITGVAAVTVTANQALTNANAAVTTANAAATAAAAAQATANQALGSRKISEFRTGGAYSWFCPSGVTSVFAQVQGGGGGGGYSSFAPGVTGSGGGSGGYSEKRVTVVPGTIYGVVVGAGGIRSSSSASSVTAGTGGVSYFRSTAVILANGGVGGGSSNVGAGAGAAAGIGDVTLPGVAGEDAGPGGDANQGGSGGSSPSGGVGAQTEKTSPGVYAVSAPMGAGSGGNGSCSVPVTTNYSGTAGYVILTW